MSNSCNISFSRAFSSLGAIFSCLFSRSSFDFSFSRLETSTGVCARNRVTSWNMLKRDGRRRLMMCWGAEGFFSQM